MSRRTTQIAALERLGHLRDAGVVDGEEFAAQKRRILERARRRGGGAGGATAAARRNSVSAAAVGARQYRRDPVVVHDLG